MYVVQTSVELLTLLTFSTKKILIMAKVGFWLQGATGKISGANLSTSPGGATILRKNAHPSNPQTTKQCQQRAKFKLMSQVAAAFKSVIAIPRDGEKSPRNIFVKENFPLVYMDPDNGAALDFYNMQLTKSTIPFDNSDLKVNYGEDEVQVYIDTATAQKAVVVEIYIDNVNEKFKRQVEHIVNLNADGIGSISFPKNPELDGVLVYGIIENDDAETSRVKFEDYSTNIGAGASFLDYVRYYLNNGTNVTRTYGVKFTF